MKRKRSESHRMRKSNEKVAGNGWQRERTDGFGSNFCLPLLRRGEVYLLNHSCFERWRGRQAEEPLSWQDAAEGKNRALLFSSLPKPLV